MTHSSMQARVLRAMPPVPAELTARQVHERLGEWAYQTVKHALLELIQSGDVIRGGTHKEPTFRKTK